MSPKPFTEQEKVIVRRRLIDAAERFLATTGIKKTSVEELAKAAGISKGAFYLFYASKELLFLDALEREQILIHEEILRRVATATSVQEGFVLAVVQMYRGYVAKPWLIAFTGEDYEMLLRRIPPERIAQHIELDDTTTRRLFEFIGSGLTIEPEMLSAAMRMLFMGILHRKEVGEAWADKAFEFMVQALACRIFGEETK